MLQLEKLKLEFLLIFLTMLKFSLRILQQLICLALLNIEITIMVQMTMLLLFIQKSYQNTRQFS